MRLWPQNLFHVNNTSTEQILRVIRNATKASRGKRLFSAVYL